MAEGREAAPRVSAVIVNYRSAQETRGAVAALREGPPAATLEVVVVDNASTDEERARLREIPGIRLLENPRNEGYGQACNRGVAAARGEHVLLLNPDVRARPGAVDRLVEAALGHPEAMLLAPRLVAPDGTAQHAARRFYRFRTLLARRTPLGRTAWGARENAYHLRHDRDGQQDEEVDWALGACLLARRADFLGLGGFDPRFFLYFEDVDLCLRAWRAGRSVRLVAGAVAVHAHRRSSARPGWSPARRAHLVSMLRFIAKHRGLPGRPRRGEP